MGATPAWQWNQNVVGSRLWDGNTALIESCQCDNPEDAITSIIEMTWIALTATTDKPGKVRKKKSYTMTPGPRVRGLATLQCHRTYLRSPISSTLHGKGEFAVT